MASCNPPIPEVDSDEESTSTSCLGVKRGRVAHCKEGAKRSKYVLKARELTSPRKMPRKKENVRKKSKAQLEASSAPALSLSTAVKQNPLFVDSASATNDQPQSSTAESTAGATAGSTAGATDDAVFYGQRKNIRRTKEKEMISAILDLARYGEKTMGAKRKKHQSLIEKAKKLGSRSTPLKHKSPVKKPGPFFLRAPLKSRNVIREVKRFSP